MSKEISEAPFMKQEVKFIEWLKEARTEDYDVIMFRTVLCLQKQVSGARRIKKWTPDSLAANRIKE